MTSIPPEPPSLIPLASLTTSSTTRTWQSVPHPSLSLLATATDDKTVTIHSLRDFRLLSTISGGHKRSVRTVAWKANDSGGAVGKRKETVLATGSFDANVGIWTKNDLSGGARRTGSDNDGDEEDEQQEIDLTADGITDADEDEEWAFTSLLTGPDSEIKSIAFSPTAHPALLATSSRDKSVWVWEEVEEGEWETIAVLAEHTGDVKCVAWCPGGGYGGGDVLASGSYDDTVRLWRDVVEEGDWGCVGVLEGHGGTVWDLAWEEKIMDQTRGEEERRLASCSDDLSVRIWKREVQKGDKQRQGRGAASAPKLPSTIRPPSSMETWVLDSVLPTAHVRSIYSIAWSSTTGLIVSCGGDGSIFVYKEVPTSSGTADEVIQNNTETTTTTSDIIMTDSENDQPASATQTNPGTEWILVAQMEAAHGEFEINHVCWAKRYDRGVGDFATAELGGDVSQRKKDEDEEVIVSTGDDGVVRIWTLPASDQVKI